jgi:hypothetical protein
VPKTQNLFDDANDRFHRALAQTINGVIDVGLEFVGHLDDGRRIGAGGAGCSLIRFFQI